MTTSDLREATTSIVEQRPTPQTNLRLIEEGILNGIQILRRLDLFDGRKCSYSFERAKSRIAKIFEADPILANVIVEDQIIGAHSSTSGSLLGVIDHGLRPQRYLREHNIPLVTGANDEGSFGVNINNVSMFVWYEAGDVIQDPGWWQGSITIGKVEEWLQNFQTHVADDIKKFGSQLSIDEFINQNIRLATFYSRLQTIRTILSKPDKTPDEQLNAELTEKNFPVIYMAKSKSLTQDRITIVRTSRGNEFAIRNGIDQEELLLLVPNEQVGQTQELAKSRKQLIQVLPYEGYLSLEPSLVDHLQRNIQE